MAKLDVDIELIEKLADLMADKGLTELVVEEDDTKLRLQRGGGAPVYAAGPAPIPAAAPSAAVAAPTAETAGNHPGAIKAPMVGTAYLAPEPGADAFVSVGQQVSAGQTLLIIEAMKTMNHIPAPASGVVKRILVTDGTPVEYGAPLMIIE